jgi:hypothetical protein
MLGTTTTLTLRSNAGTGVSATTPVVPAVGDVVSLTATLELA